MNKVALICGVSGQDGAYLARLLLNKRYRVVGTSRDAQLSSFSNLKSLGIDQDVEFVSMALNDFRSVLQVIHHVRPHEIYNFAGQSSVGLSFEEPVETLQSHAIGTLNLLEAVRFLDNNARIYNASSGECFGNLNGLSATESTPFYPRSPYAVAKASAFWECVNYREAYNIFVSSGILFNHESPLRPVRFVTRKIVSTACRIAKGSKEKLMLGDLSIKRDWGWAPEYVQAMWSMLQLEAPEDFVIATGESNSLEDFVREAFEYLGLSWTDHVVTDSTLARPSEIFESRGDATKARQKLDWTPSRKMREVVQSMIDADFDER